MLAELPTEEVKAYDAYLEDRAQEPEKLEYDATTIEEDLKVANDQEWLF